MCALQPTGYSVLAWMIFRTIIVSFDSLSVHAFTAKLLCILILTLSFPLVAGMNWFCPFCFHKAHKMNPREPEKMLHDTIQITGNGIYLKFCDIVEILQKLLPGNLVGLFSFFECINAFKSNPGSTICDSTRGCNLAGHWMTCVEPPPKKKKKTQNSIPNFLINET